jgi:hypothetical protein
LRKSGDPAAESGPRVFPGSLGRRIITNAASLASFADLSISTAGISSPPSPPRSPQRKSNTFTMSADAPASTSIPGAISMPTQG